MRKRKEVKILWNITCCIQCFCCLQTVAPDSKQLRRLYTKHFLMFEHLLVLLYILHDNSEHQESEQTKKLHIVTLVAYVYTYELAKVVKDSQIEQ